MKSIHKLANIRPCLPSCFIFQPSYFTGSGIPAGMTVLFSYFKLQPSYLNMQTVTVKLSSQGQLIIPQSIREELHWDEGIEGN